MSHTGDLCLTRCLNISRVSGSQHKRMQLLFASKTEAVVKSEYYGLDVWISITDDLEFANDERIQHHIVLRCHAQGLFGLPRR